MRPKIFFYSDCAFFAGCENMLANFFNSNTFTEQYDVSFSYRVTKEYETGFRTRVKDPKIAILPVRLLDITDIYAFISRMPSWSQKILKVVIHIH